MLAPQLNTTILEMMTMAMHRTPKTSNERRRNDNEDHGGYVVKMRKRTLPTSYDDIPANNTRSWKKHRRTKYKAA